jgi:hypothetical protein
MHATDPNGDDKEDDRGEHVYWPFPINLCQRVHEEHTESKSENQPGCSFGEDVDLNIMLVSCLCKIFILVSAWSSYRDAELCGDGNESGS